MKKLTLASMAGLVIVLSTPAFAVPSTTTQDDAILSFRIDDATGTGAGTDLEVDLGAASEFTSTAVLNFSGPTGLELADLVSTYGANFATRGDLVFDVAGALTTTSFIATEGGVVAKEDSSVGNAVGNISTMQGVLGGEASTSNSTEAAMIGTSTNPASGIAGSYTAETTGFANQFGYDKFVSTDGVTSTETTVDGALTTLNLYEYVPASGHAGGTPSLLGTFDLTSGGTLTYLGASAAPEPSTWALMFGGLGMLFLAMRRRNSFQS